TGARSSWPAWLHGRDRHPRHEGCGELPANDLAPRRPYRRRPASMNLLRLISWPYVRKHVLRTILTTAGIVLGVAVFLGMNAANENVLQAFSRTVDRIAGKTELQICAGELSFP